MIWGDKKYVLPSLLAEFSGKVNLIYIDPPFDTGADFRSRRRCRSTDDEDETGIAFTKEPSLIEQKAYRDTWGRGIDSYLQWFYEQVLLLNELMAVRARHRVCADLDSRLCHYAKGILDEVFGPAMFVVNDIAWMRSHSARRYRPGCESILAESWTEYLSSAKATFAHGTLQYQPYTDERVGTRRISTRSRRP